VSASRQVDGPIQVDGPKRVDGANHPIDSRARLMRYFESCDSGWLKSGDRLEISR